MKLSPLNIIPAHPLTRRTRQLSATTLTEMMVTMAVFTLMIAAMFQMHIAGLLTDQLANSKMGASDQSRRGFSKMLMEIRAAKSIRICTNFGAPDYTNYTILSNQTLRGQALKICLTTNTSQFILYYFITNQAAAIDGFNSGTNELRRATNNSNDYDVITQNLVSNAVFTAEDYSGNPLTGLNNHPVIGVWLQFYQFKYPLTRVGSNYLYDNFKIEFKATPRCYD